MGIIVHSSSSLLLPSMRTQSRGFHWKLENPSYSLSDIVTHTHTHAYTRPYMAVVSRIIAHFDDVR